MITCRQQASVDNERLRQLQEAEAACEAEAFAAARAVEYRNELRHRLDIQVSARPYAVVPCTAIQLFCCVSGKMSPEYADVALCSPQVLFLGSQAPLSDHV